MAVILGLQKSALEQGVLSPDTCVMQQTLTILCQDMAG